MGLNQIGLSQREGQRKSMDRKHTDIHNLPAPYGQELLYGVRQQSIPSERKHP
jgi:hypothetical protein